MVDRCHKHVEKAKKMSEARKSSPQYTKEHHKFPGYMEVGCCILKNVALLVFDSLKTTNVGSFAQIPLRKEAACCSALGSPGQFSAPRCVA